MSLLAQDERLTRRVGGIVLLLLAIAILFFVFIVDKIEWGRHIRVAVYFRGTGGLREGASLVVAGQPVGRIESIALSPRGAPGPLDGEEGVVATVAIERDVARHIHRGGDIFVASRGPFSERYLEIAPAPDPDAPVLAQGDRLRGIDPPTLDRVLQRTFDNVGVAMQFADAVGPELDRLRGELRQLATTMDELQPNIAGVASLGVEVEGLLAETDRLRDVTLGGEAGLDRLARVVDQARLTIAKARTMLDTLGQRARVLTASVDRLRDRIGERGPAAIHAVEVAIDRVRAAIDKIDPLLAKVQELTDRIARGEGTIGRLAQDPEFPEDAKELGKILKRQPWKVIARPQN
ncbi:MAG TPA: MlaD family protein [Kofleriaceae bacterium]|nr:MlaD family protein [Kofleriaceae bacterium]